MNEEKPKLKWSERPVFPTPDEVIVRGGQIGKTNYEECVNTVLQGQMSSAEMLSKFDFKTIVKNAFHVADQVAKVMDEK